MTRSRWGPLCHTNSTATADGTPPEIHWWTARVLSNLIYPSSTRTSSRDGTRRTTNWQIDVPACEQEHHSQAGQCVHKPRCDGPPGFRPMAWALYVSARRHYWQSETSECLVSHDDSSCGRPLMLQYSIVWFNVPLHILYTISETIFLTNHSHLASTGTSSSAVAEAARCFVSVSS